jgi:hypothetical protein
MTASSLAQSVQPNLQAALYKKIFSFDKTLATKGNFEITVIGSGSDEIVTAFKAAGLNAKSADQISAGTAVVYLMPGASSTKTQTAAKKILSISGSAPLVENGTVAIGIGTEGGKPKILIHIGQLKSEGHEISSDLLQLAKIIQ